MRKRAIIIKLINNHFFHLEILFYKVEAFLSVAKDLDNHWTHMFLLYSEASFKSQNGFRLFYIYKSGYGLGYFPALPYPFEQRAQRC